MEIFQFLQALGFIVAALLIYKCWLLPIRAYKRLRKNGFEGPNPSFPLGNIDEMRKKEKRDSPLGSLNAVTHNIHSTVFPYFARWRKLHGKVFVYWLGTEPFLYVADPEFLKQMSSGVMAKNWGKPNVFKYDRKPMFGNGLIMAEGEEWVHHRNIIAPALSPANLKAMASSMEESANKMLDQWAASILVSGEEPTIDVESDIISTAAEIIAKTIFGINDENGRKVFEKLRDMQVSLFKSNRLVGVPFSKLMSLKQTSESRRLGKEIDGLLLSIITSRKRRNSFGDDDDDQHHHEPQHYDLLGLLLSDSGGNQKKLTGRELVDECKTFFFGGHETTALAISWTLLLLALNPEWQDHLREEIKEVAGDGPLDPTMLARLKKMGWVMNEVLRLYPPAPNAQRQAREDIQVGHTIVPKGTNIWIDIVGMHHDQTIWGDEVHEFRPERFKGDPNGGCKHRMGYLPFGFGGRICVGRNLTMMEYKIVLTLILRRFSFSLSPSYCHSPTILLSLRPNNGLPLIFQAL